jgi:hypothetical protein
MKRLPVVSNAIRSIGYDPDNEAMEVEFHNGYRYLVKKAPKGLYRRFMNTDSHGDFWNAEIRQSYEMIRLAPAKESRAADEEPEL